MDPNILPYELWEAIFNYVPTADYTSCALTCRVWSVCARCILKRFDWRQYATLVRLPDDLFLAHCGQDTALVFHQLLHASQSACLPDLPRDILRKVGTRLANDTWYESTGSDEAMHVFFMEHPEYTSQCLGGLSDNDFTILCTEHKISYRAALCSPGITTRSIATRLKWDHQIAYFNSHGLPVAYDPGTYVSFVETYKLWDKVELSDIDHFPGLESFFAKAPCANVPVKVDLAITTEIMLRNMIRRHIEPKITLEDLRRWPIIAHHYPIMHLVKGELSDNVLDAIFAAQDISGDQIFRVTNLTKYINAQLGATQNHSDLVKEHKRSIMRAKLLRMRQRLRNRRA